jgi:hypothetical protein
LEKIRGNTSKDIRRVFESKGLGKAIVMVRSEGPVSKGKKRQVRRTKILTKGPRLTRKVAIEAFRSGLGIVTCSPRSNTVSIYTGRESDVVKRIRQDR